LPPEFLTLEKTMERSVENLYLIMEKLNLFYILLWIMLICINMNFVKMMIVFQNVMACSIVDGTNIPVNSWYLSTIRLAVYTPPQAPQISGICLCFYLWKKNHGAQLAKETER
jgi:hypothetical protein